MRCPLYSTVHDWIGLLKRRLRAINQPSLPSVTADTLLALAQDWKRLTEKKAAGTDQDAEDLLARKQRLAAMGLAPEPLPGFDRLGPESFVPLLLATMHHDCKQQLF